MIHQLAERRTLRMKRNILRGVLEDNLYQTGKRGRRHLAGGPTVVRKFLLSLYLACIMVIMHGTFLSMQWFPERQIRAGLVADGQAFQGTMEVPEGTFTGEEYQALLRNHDIPLWRLLGLEVKTIMIDAGHGGNDSGAIGKLGTMEKDMALDIARRLQRRLELNDRYRVVMTRVDDRTLGLNERVGLAGRKEADIFVSIHLNYLPQKPLNIIETFYFGPSDDVKAARLAEKENAGSEFGLNDFKAMVERLNDDLRLQESRDLAVSIQSNLFAGSSEGNDEIKDYGIKRAPFVVLLGVDVPAVLVEVSCLSNTDEERDLNNEEHREDIARYLETGILDYTTKQGEPRNVAKR
jgi:N-acetylmuramoyl-L-alanine amidase